jgi:hypothetical protein
LPTIAFSKVRDIIIYKRKECYLHILYHKNGIF